MADYGKINLGWNLLLSGFIPSSLLLAQFNRINPPPSPSPHFMAFFLAKRLFIRRGTIWEYGWMILSLIVQD
jgi:hypothetical protein